MKYGFKAARESAGLTGENAAQTLGVSRQVLSYWETGRNNPSFAHLLQLAKLYQVTLDELVYGDGGGEARTR